MSEILFKCLSKAKTLEQALIMNLGLLEEEFSKTGDPKLREKESAIKYYKKSIFNKQLIASYRTLFNNLYDMYDKEIPEMLFDLDGNKKSAKSYIEKINMLQAECRSLSAAYKDIHRFRLTITNSCKDNSKMIELLENAVSVTIGFFLGKDFVLSDPNPAKDTENFSKEKHPDIFIPKKSIIPKLYEARVKDYVSNPKSSGYQGIHLFFIDGKNNVFEFQLRTLAMDTRAKYGTAKQEKFKKKTRDVKNWNLQNITVENFEFFEIKDSGEQIIVDKAGIIEPVVTFARRKTF